MSAVDRRYNNSEKGRARYVAYLTRHPQRHRARAAVNNALRDRRLEREPCYSCGAPKTQAHHWLGYDPAYMLDVVWLCRSHHVRAHREEDNLVENIDNLQAALGAIGVST